MCPKWRQCLCSKTAKDLGAVKYECCGCYCKACSGYLGETTDRPIVKRTVLEKVKYKPIITDKVPQDKKK